MFDADKELGSDSPSGFVSQLAAVMCFHPSHSYTRYLNAIEVAQAFKCSCIPLHNPLPPGLTS